MSFLILDENKCKKDRICVNECPFGIIEMDKENGYPRFADNGTTLCNSCGHCVAVCPHDALSHKYVPIKESPLIDGKLSINESQAVQFLRSRRSIRRFKDKAVEKEKIQQLIEIARYAPTARNAQQLEWMVYADKNKMKALSTHTADWMRDNIEKNPKTAPPYFSSILAAWDKGEDQILRNAPVVIVVSAPRESSYGMVDLSLALSYFELAAPLFGLGTCWAGLLEGALKNRPAAAKALGLSDDRPYHYPMMLGYPAYPANYYKRLPQRRKPRIVWE
ncbi:MAG: nitroreductase family protein [Spirochaetes bacterium]|nr:nitroreductase family protein [Spirochaetota bacterium]